jgi:membrane protein DedA with SNARE-associated domain
LIAVLLLFAILFISLTYLEDVTETGGAGGVISSLTSLPRRVIDLAAAAGYAGIFALMLLEAAAFPIPSEIILPLAGYLVSKGQLEFWLVVLYSTVAALLGSFVDYFLGWRLGISLSTGRARFPYLDAARLRRAHIWFDRYGPLSVAFFRLVPAARVLISFPAGAYGMSKSKFATYTLLGCLPWNIMLVYLGWWLGSSWERVVAAFRYINLAAYAFLAIFVFWVSLRLTTKRTEQRQRRS